MRNLLKELNNSTEKDLFTITQQNHNTDPKNLTWTFDLTMHKPNMMPIKQLNNVPAPELRKIEKELEDAVLKIFNKYLNKYRKIK